MSWKLHTLLRDMSQAEEEEGGGCDRWVPAGMHLHLHLTLTLTVTCADLSSMLHSAQSDPLSTDQITASVLDWSEMKRKSKYELCSDVTHYKSTKIIFWCSASQPSVGLSRGNYSHKWNLRNHHPCVYVCLEHHLLLLRSALTDPGLHEACKIR